MKLKAETTAGIFFILFLIIFFGLIAISLSPESSAKSINHIHNLPVSTPGERFDPNLHGLRKSRGCQVGIVPLQLPIIRVIDGDTIKSKLSLPAPLDDISIRIYGIDTPEPTKRAKCSTEIEKGKMATAFVKDLVKDESIMIITGYSWDKFGGRINANVEIGGKDLGTLLIENELAKPYFGSGPKYNWCQ